MRPMRHLLTGLLLCLCINAFAGEPPDGARLQAVKRMLEALDLGGLYVKEAEKKLTAVMKTNPTLAEDVDWMIWQITSSEAIDRISGVYAEYLTAPQADELRTFFTKPPGNKSWQITLEQMENGKPPLFPILTKEERRTVDAFKAKSAAWRAFDGSAKAINGKLDNVLGDWIGQMMQKRYAGLLQALADALDESGSERREGESRPPPPENGEGRNGGMYEGFLLQIRDIGLRNRNVIKRFNAKAEEIDLRTALAPANLTSRTGIDDGRRKLDLYEAEFSKSQQEINRLHEEMTASLNQLSVPEEKRDATFRMMEMTVVSLYERSIRSEENQRRSLAIMRNILALADECMGRIHLQDGRLTFDDGSDQERFESLRQQLETQAGIEKEIEQEQTRIRANAVKRLRETAGDTTDSRKATKFEASGHSQN